MVSSFFSDEVGSALGFGGIAVLIMSIPYLLIHLGLLLGTRRTILQAIPENAR